MSTLESIEGASDDDEKESVVSDTCGEILVLEKTIVLNTEAVVAKCLIEVSEVHFYQKSFSY